MVKTTIDIYVVEETGQSFLGWRPLQWCLNYTHILHESYRILREIVLILVQENIIEHIMEETSQESQDGENLHVHSAMEVAHLRASNTGGTWNNL